jgi:hypothetical protein
MQKLEIGELVMYLVGSSLQFGFELAILGPTFTKC